MNDWRLIHVPEPALAFGFGQNAEHPKDGLFLFGPPASNQNPARMDIGVIGTPEGIRCYETWVKSITGTIAAPIKGKAENKMMWPASRPCSECLGPRSHSRRASSTERS